MINSSRFSYMKFNLFSTITFAFLILVIIFSDSIISSVPIQQNAFENVPNLLHTHQAAGVLEITEADVVVVAPSFAKIPTWPDEMGIFEESDPTRRFDSRVREFFSRNQCKVQAFMTWISPLDSYGQREFFGLETLFETNPSICLIILSETMDSYQGFKILEPLLERGFHVQAMTPDLGDLIRNTPAEIWFNDIKNGVKNPGEIPLPQNLSNLIRLAVLYKYGGIYLDTDFIILKNLEGLRNSIGAQSVDLFGNWTRLNNAVLVFDSNHPLLYKFLEEFASTFDGNVWGHNGPYLVSRVVEKLAKTEEFYNFTVLPPMAFYPVSWGKVAGFFARPSGRVGERWVGAKIRQLSRLTYGVHLWNSKSSGIEIEEGSIMERLISDHCVVCSKPTSWSS
ncbi:lactosylceramide 4-alpha-galactosyltransferase [Salvia divinorum]|uniref:Lactosylceramide 4-alpha-galactosyltransferase n=1 Tax=Salvia divinorum TaxID=28513 RepID=A0ABD1GNF4_SALDI